MLPSERSGRWCRHSCDTAKYRSSPRLPTAQSPTRRTVPGGRSAAGRRSDSVTDVSSALRTAARCPYPCGGSGNSGGPLLVRRVRTSWRTPRHIGGSSVRRLSVVLGLMATLLLAAGGPALADPPFGASGRVTDQAGVLSSSDKDRIEQAIDELQKNEGISEYVVLVDSFDGQNGKQWAAQTAEQSGLGANDVMLAVAVGGERHDGVHYGSAIDADKLNTVIVDDVEPKLSDGDWAGAAVALAEGLGGGSGSGVSSGTATLLVVIGLIVLAGGAYLFFRARGRRRDREATPAIE